MSRHLFLTGEPQVGKSTLLHHYLTQQHGTVGGFCTVWGNASHTTLHLLPYTGGVCCVKNCVAVRENGILLPHSTVFDTLGCALLKAPCDLLVMDELGYLESDALEFQRAVLAALDGKQPVLGVIKPQHTPFLDAVRAHTSVHIVEVTMDNRETLTQPQDFL